MGNSMGKSMGDQSGSAGSARAGRQGSGRRGIALDVAGADLMLRGRFSDWESGLSSGPDLDKVRVRLAIDATSVAGDDTEPLFTFHSRRVELTGPGTYLAQGTFRRPDGEARDVEVTVEAPPGHTPLFVVSFAADKSDLGDGWSRLVENVIPFTSVEDGQPVRQAHAWLTTPVLAAA